MKAISESKSIFLFTVLFIEAGIFFLSKVIAPDPTIYYELAARYSARISFFILCGIFLWMGLTGLPQIFNDHKKRDFYQYLMLLFTLNHLIHFAFIYLNYQANQYALFTMNHLPGTIGYILIILLPLLVFKIKKLPVLLCFILYFYLVSIMSFFIMTYYGRLSKELPYPTANWVFISFLIIIGGIFLLNIFRIGKDLYLKKY